MDKEQRDQLRKVAEEATRGERIISREGFSTVYVEARIGGGMLQEIAAFGPCLGGQVEQVANAELCAAANPATILQLLDYIETLEKDAARYRWQPIETAPQDGTVFLGRRGRMVREAYRVQRDDCEMWVFGSASGSVKIAPQLKPTHWMPLPDDAGEKE